ncbi:hypothetical protein BGX38DRAFT_373396, partial [Terfezia claveryi]
MEGLRHRGQALQLQLHVFVLRHQGHREDRPRGQRGNVPLNFSSSRQEPRQYPNNYQFNTTCTIVPITAITNPNSTTHGISLTATEQSAAAVLQQLARSGTQNSLHTVPPQTPTQPKATPVIAATTPSGGALPALPPSPPLTRSATRSRSSVITATQSHQYVDYLLANGGLPRPISITFSARQGDPHEIDYILAKGGEIPEVSYAPINTGH